MNQATIVKVQVEADKVLLRLWVDDESGQHLAVCETTFRDKDLAHWWVEMRQKQDDAKQDPLPFDV